MLLDDAVVDPERVEAEAEHALEHHAPPRGAVTTEEDPHDHRGTRAPARLVVPALLLAALSLGLGLGGELMLSLAEQAAAALSDTSAYVQAVIGR